MKFPHTSSALNTFKIVVVVVVVVVLFAVKFIIEK